MQRPSVLIEPAIETLCLKINALIDLTGLSPDRVRILDEVKGWFTDEQKDYLVTRNDPKLSHLECVGMSNGYLVLQGPKARTA